MINEYTARVAKTRFKINSKAQKQILELRNPPRNKGCGLLNNVPVAPPTANSKRWEILYTEKAVASVNVGVQCRERTNMQRNPALNRIPNC